MEIIGKQPSNGLIITLLINNLLQLNLTDDSSMDESVGSTPTLLGKQRKESLL